MKENFMYVYLLWSHAEDGPEELVATLDRDKVISLAKEQNRDGWFERVECDPVGRLEALLLKDDQELLRNSDPDNFGKTQEGIHNLMGGWGGLHFQVVKLS